MERIELIRTIRELDTTAGKVTIKDWHNFCKMNAKNIVIHSGVFCGIGNDYNKVNP